MLLFPLTLLFVTLTQLRLNFYLLFLEVSDVCLEVLRWHDILWIHVVHLRVVVDLLHSSKEIRLKLQGLQEVGVLERGQVQELNILVHWWRFFHSY